MFHLFGTVSFTDSMTPFFRKFGSCIQPSNSRSMDEKPGDWDWEDGISRGFSKWSRSKTRKQENAGRWLRNQIAWEHVAIQKPFVAI